MMRALELCVCLLMARAARPDTDLRTTSEPSSAPRETTLSSMLQEVEELMKDTQRRLQDAVRQMDDESAKSTQPVQNFTSNYNNESSSQTLEGNQSTLDEEKINKLSDNVTQVIHESRAINQSNGTENDIAHECIIDEDCEKGRYCLYETHQSQCLPCKDLNATCTKDEECCEDQLCVWGQCSKNVTKGEAGTICQYQSDCSHDLCCAFHKALLFPVCSCKPTKYKHCVISANHLMELLSWDMEGEGPREHCPCAGDLQCQHLGRGTVCLKGQSSSEEDLTDALYSEIDYIV